MNTIKDAPKLETIRERLGRQVAEADNIITELVLIKEGIFGPPAAVEPKPENPVPLPDSLKRHISQLEQKLNTIHTLTRNILEAL